MEEAFVGLERPWWSKMQRGSARGLVGHHWGAGCHWVGGEVSERAIIAISLVGVQPPSWHFADAMAGAGVIYKQPNRTYSGIPESTAGFVSH